MPFTDRVVTHTYEDETGRMRRTPDTACPDGCCLVTHDPVLTRRLDSHTRYGETVRPMFEILPDFFADWCEICEGPCLGGRDE